jgi:DNA-binding CsgD family transcriptional regulator
LDLLAALLADLELVTDLCELERWVRTPLKEHLPHAAFLATYGMLLCGGMVATHRIAVDFPLNIIEEVKNPLGSVVDPLISRWMGDQRPQYSNIADVGPLDKYAQWRNTLGKYGLRDAITHGYVDAPGRRFVTVQVFNPAGCGSNTGIEIVKAISTPIAATARKIIGNRASVRDSLGLTHPAIFLTTAELLTVELVARGFSNKEIARYRGVSDATVKTQISRAGAKLGAKRRAEIVAATMGMLNSASSVSS